MSENVREQEVVWGRVRHKVDEVLLRSCFSGLTIEEIVKETGEKQDSIRKVLERGEYHYELSEDGVRKYFHPRCHEILKALKTVLLELNEEFSKSPVASNPSMNRIVTPKYLAEKIFRELEHKNEQLVKDITVEGIERLVREVREEIERKLIHALGLRVRIGGINYP